MQIVVLPGLREIEAGQSSRANPSATPAWVTSNPVEQWLRGNRSARIPGSIDGNEFDARFDEAVRRHLPQRPAASGRVLARRRDHDVDDDERRRSPARPRAVAALPNTGIVVVQGNPQDGWTTARLEWNQARRAMISRPALVNTNEHIHPSPGGTVTEQTALPTPSRRPADLAESTRRTSQAGEGRHP